MKKPESVQEELLYLCEKNEGVLNPHDVVNYAKNEKTHLHNHFEWDDTKAAYQYRLEQARQLIRLEFEIVNQHGITTGPVRLFVSLKDDRNTEGGYRLIKDVLSDEEKRKRLFEEALSEFIRVRDKYNSINELQGIFEAITKVESDYTQ